MLEPRRKCGLGWRPDLPDPRDHLFRAAVAPQLAGTALPVRAKVLGVEGFPVFDQGQTNSCVGHSVAELHAIVRRVTPRSRLQVYYEARRLINETDRDEGAYVRDAIKVISQLGAGRETWWPFDPAQIFTDPPEKVDRDALKRRIFSYSRLLGPDDYRLSLAAGHPFVIGISCFDNLFSDLSARTGLYLYPQAGERNEGGHAILAWGYDMDFPASQLGQQLVGQGASVPGSVYFLRGSWGGDFGWHGNHIVDARIIDDARLSDDAWHVLNLKAPAGSVQLV